MPRPLQLTAFLGRFTFYYKFYVISGISLRLNHDKNTIRYPPRLRPGDGNTPPSPSPQPGETQGIKTHAKTYPPPTIVALSPAPHGVDGAPSGVNDAPIDSDGSATLLSPGTSAVDQFLTPPWTTALRTAVPREIVTPGVITKNSYEPLAATIASDDDEPPAERLFAPPPRADLLTFWRGKKISEQKFLRTGNR